MRGRVYKVKNFRTIHFGYNAKTVVYTNSSSDIPKLSEIAGDGIKEVFKI